MDSSTTSPVESQNSIVHQKLGINSKTDTHRSVKFVAENSQQMITDHHSRALLMLNLTNKASKSPTRDYIASKSQSIADQNYDVCNTSCLAQITTNSWWCWNFDKANDHLSNEQNWPRSALPSFLRVRTMTLHCTDNLCFLKCD